MSTKEKKTEMREKETRIAIKALVAAYDEVIHSGCNPWEVRYALLLTYFLDTEKAMVSGYSKKHMLAFTKIVHEVYLEEVSKHPEVWK